MDHILNEPEAAAFLNRHPQTCPTCGPDAVWTVAVEPMAAQLLFGDMEYVHPPDNAVVVARCRCGFTGDPIWRKDSGVTGDDLNL